MASESHSLPAVQDDNIQWTQVRSQSGVVFEVGVAKDVVNAESLKKVEIQVNWPLTNGVWKNTEGEVAKYISQYKLDKNYWSPLWDWRLDFTNKQKGTFGFTDETGDTYYVSCYFEGDYYVRYNSKMPAIKKVTITQ